MADLVITPANVQPTGSTQQRNGIAAVAINAGQAIYINSSNQVALCEHDQTAVEAACQGIALSSAAAGQPITYAVGGEIDLGSVLSAGAVFIVGAGAGGIAPEADAGAGDYVTVLGVAVSATNLKIGIVQSGVTHA